MSRPAPADALMTAGATGSVAVTAAAVTHCRSCGSHELTAFLDLGATPIANKLVDPATAPESDPVFPLSVGFCASCSLVQLTNELPAAAIFGADYPYFSSFSDDLLTHSREHVEELMRQRGLGPGSFVVELASNDGYLLANFLPHGVGVLGVEPCAGPAAAARKIGVSTLEAYFDAELGARLRAERGAADVVVANNVMAHVPDLNGFVAGMAALVSDDGVVVVENPSVQFLLEHVEFDTVYHEHFCYFSTIAVERLFRRHGLYLQEVAVFPDMHGGTVRWTAGKVERRSPAVDRLLDQERAAGLADSSVYRAFGERVERTKAELLELLRSLRAEGHSIAAYGAAAKGATLLNSTGIGVDLVDFVVDRSPVKQGKLVPGARIPIVDPAALVSRKPDYVLLLAWNFRIEILRQQAAYVASGGQFIVPVPSVGIVM